MSPVESLSDLYLEDETAWLDRMAQLLAERRHEELDYDHLQEFLTDMASRDRREVENRLKVLLMHLLKWVYQPDQRSRSWQSTILNQQDELTQLIRKGVLRNHAEATLPEAYPRAVRLAAVETGLEESTFPAECPFDLDQALSVELDTL